MVRRTSIIIALLISSAPAALSAQRAPTTPETTAPATGEIIMRRPIPGTRGSSTPVTPSNPEGEEETIPQPDGNPDYSGINATYYATASCESNSISLTCIEMQNNGTTVTFQTTSSLGACELQDESTPDYQYAVANGPIPEGGVIVPPQEGLFVVPGSGMPEHRHRERYLSCRLLWVGGRRSYACGAHAMFRSERRDRQW